MNSKQLGIIDFLNSMKDKWIFLIVCEILIQDINQPNRELIPLRMMKVSPIIDLIIEMGFLVEIYMYYYDLI
jgi:hypothetical protein